MTTVTPDNIRNTVIQTINSYNEHLVYYKSRGEGYGYIMLMVRHIIFWFCIFSILNLFGDSLRNFIVSIIMSFLFKSTSLMTKSTPNEIYEKTEMAAAYAAQMKERPIRLQPIIDDKSFFDDIKFVGHVHYERYQDGVIKAISKLKTLSIEFYIKEEVTTSL